MENGNSIKAFVESTINKVREIRVPAKKLTSVLNYVTAINRPGISKVLITSNIIEANGKYGINTGNNPDGTENVVNEFVYNVVDKVVNSIQEDAVVHVTIPAGALNIQAEGANAGGPVVVVGTNITPITVPGIIR